MKTIPIQNNKLPEGWEIRKLSEVYSILESGGRPKGGVHQIKEGIPSIGGEHVNDSRGFNFDKIKYIPEDFFNSMTKGKIQEGDILIVKDGATTGKVSYVDNIFPYKKAAVNEHVFRLRGKFDRILQKYLFYFIFSNEGQRQIMLNFQGTAQGGINQKFINNFFIPLPFSNNLKKSLETQQKIVQKLDAFFESYNKLKQEKQKAKEKYEQILQSAIASLIPKKALLKGWKIDKLVNLCSQKPQYGYTAKSVKEEVGPIYLRITDIDFKGKIDWDNVKYVDIPKEDYKNFKLEQGDIIIARTGATVGKSYLYTSDKDMVFASYLIRFRSNPQVILPEYLIIYLQSSLYWSYISKERSGTGQPNVNAKKLGDLEIIYPKEIEDQKEIIKKIKQIEQFNQNFMEEQKNIDFQLSQLPKAILSKAFKGELI